MKKLLLITDAWYPQINGVVTTLTHMVTYLQQQQLAVEIIHPARFRTLPCPTYPDIRLVLTPWQVGKLIHECQPDAVHIATEGPLGIAARSYLHKHHIPYTTSLHTKFPEYVSSRFSWVPLRWGYQFLRWFHRPSQQVLVTTESNARELRNAGLEHLQVWGRGVDTEQFRPQQRPTNADPVFLYVGRVAVEKNIEAFLRLRLPGRKRVVGDGPARAELQARYPDAEWVGFKTGQALVDEYARADVFVFPSLTDTFGLVMLEALACGTPVAAFPVTGPIDVVQPGITGYLEQDLARAAIQCLSLSRADCRQFAEANSWQQCAERFVQSLVPVFTNQEDDCAETSQ